MSAWGAVLQPQASGPADWTEPAEDAISAPSVGSVGSPAWVSAAAAAVRWIQARVLTDELVVNRSSFRPGLLVSWSEPKVIQSQCDYE